MPYSKEERQEIVRLYKEGLGICKIAERLHHDTSLVSQVIKDEGIWIQGSRNFTDAEEAEIAKIYKVGGFSTRVIARAYGFNHHISICAALKRQGIKQRPKSERNRLYSLDPHVFDVIDTEDKAYWLGFLYADGHVHKRSVILILKAADKSQVEKFKAFLKSEAPVKEILGNCINGKRYPQAKFEVTEAHLAKRLKELGIIKNRPDHNKAIGAIPRHLHHHFLRGYFDGDGSAGKKGSIGFCGGENLLNWIRKTISQETGTNPSLAVSKHKKADIWYLRFAGRIQALKAASYLYRDATIWLERKRKVIDSWAEPMPRQRNEKGQYI